MIHLQGLNQAIVQTLMYQNAPNKILMISMAASLLDVFAQSEPICRELRLPEETYA